MIGLESWDGHAFRCEVVDDVRNVVDGVVQKVWKQVYLNCMQS